MRERSVVRWVSELVSTVTMILEGSIALVGTGDSRIGSKGGWGGVGETLTGSGGTGKTLSGKDVEDLALRTGRRIVGMDNGGAGGGRVGHGGAWISLRGRLDELVFVGVGSCLIGIIDKSMGDFAGGGGGVSSADKAIPSSERTFKADSRGGRLS
jgi:hypothetical protein